MKDWLAGLAPRERVIVYAVAALLVVILIYVVLVQPLYSRYDRLESNVAQQRETLQWMQQNAVTVGQLKGAKPAAEGLAGRSLLSVTDAAARAANLGSALKRVEPEGSDAVRVWLDGAAFDVVVGWLEVMSSRYGADVDTITLERAQAVGRVNVRLTLRAPGS
ncbi:MAG: type II secretion system protein M [Gammaproteobacteria bacterium]|nr:MAG: type II secretion system protein M [Gammaproteobacteria bacterium]